MQPEAFQEADEYFRKHFVHHCVQAGYWDALRSLLELKNIPDEIKRQAIEALDKHSEEMKHAT